MDWIIENIGLLTEKIFIPIIVAIITSFFGKKAKYKINYRFFVNLITGIIIAIILDQKNNTKGDLRLSVKIYAVSIICTFFLMIVLNVLFDYIIKRIKVIIKVHKLTIDECKYVIMCSKTQQYLEVNFNSYPEFEHQWNGILYIKYGKLIQINETYRIFVVPYALKMVKRKLATVKTDET